MSKLFSNYKPGVHTCDVHHHTVSEGSFDNDGYNIKKDAYGNITDIKWMPESRFTLSITSDTILPIYHNSIILKEVDETPLKLPGYSGQFAYNTSDYLCWKFDGITWIEQDDIEIFEHSNITVTFSNKRCSTRAVIRNFRGDVLFSKESEGSVVEIPVDDELSELLMQGAYYIYVYQIMDNSSKYVRRISLSISYDVNGPTSSHPSFGQVGCVRDGFAIDKTLSLRENTLSVNMATSCENGNSLPISSDSVYDYAEPKRMYILLNEDRTFADSSASEIFSYVKLGGSVLCIYNKMEIPYRTGTLNLVEFSDICYIDDELVNIVITIDSDMKANVSRGTIITKDESESLGTISSDIEFIKNTLDSIDNTIENKINESGYDDGELTLEGG